MKTGWVPGLRPALLWVILTVACDSNEWLRDGGDGDGDIEGDGDADSDADGDVDSDADSDSDIDADSDVDGDADSDADFDESDDGCTGEGPAYIHGDLWPFWYNYRVACNAQHRWLWICEQRLGEGNCSAEQQRFDDCWQARGDFPRSSWDGSTGAPSSPNYGVCQPHHWDEKNGEDRRPGNPVPCDTTTYDYDLLRTADPRFGVDWWTGGTSMRHLTIKVTEAGFDPYTREGQFDGLVNLSTHPGDFAAFMNGLSNHSYAGHARPGGCLPPLTGDGEDPWPHQNFGAFFWLEVPTDRALMLGATWIGPIGDDISLNCLGMDTVWGFPGSFSAHSVDGKPWFITSPCWDLVDSYRFEPGRHYIWDIHGLRQLPDCHGPPEELLAVVPESDRPTLRDGSCSSM